MADRHNLCTNPALGVDVTGWGGGSTPTRTAVTGFNRGWAARYVAGTFMSTAATSSGAVTTGVDYTLAVQLRVATFNVPSGAIYIEWINAGGSGFGYPSASFTASIGAVTRVSITATAPANAVAARVIIDGINYNINATDFTALLIEPVGALGSYFDGDTVPGGSWDGTPGLSASTLTTSQDASGSSAITSGAAIAPAGAKNASGAGPTPAGATLATSGAKGAAATPAVRAGASTTAQGVKGAPGYAFQAAAAALTAAGTKHATGTCRMSASARLAASVPGAASLTDLGGVLLDTGVLGGSLI